MTLEKEQDSPVLELKNLVVEFVTDEGIVRAVDGVSFKVNRGKNLGIVGESGCGKSVTSLSIMRLIPEPPGRVISGEINFGDENILTLPQARMRKLRGNRISMIFQEPMTSLNPVMSIGYQLIEAATIHSDLTKKEARKRSLEMLELVGIPAAHERMDAYPHQLSGGMRQRVMIAMALFCKPDLLIADEPTTALDVTIQAQIMDLMKRLQAEIAMSILLITHDLAVVAESCDDVVIMYAGVVVEQGSVHDIFYKPRHPYTLGLLKSIPGIGIRGLNEKNRLETIPGLVPNLLHLPQGCRFQDRCSRVLEKCRQVEPSLELYQAEHKVRCYNPVPQ